MTKDWFETLVAQDLVLDAIVYRLVFEDLRKALKSSVGIVLVTDMPAEVHADDARWVDAMVKIAAAESPSNKTLLSGWFASWRERGVAAARPLAEHLFGTDAEGVLARLVAELNTRAGKLGIVEVAS